MRNLLYEIKNLQIKSTPKSGAIKILNNINFNIKRGEIFGLIGESGSGKSMLGCALLEMVPVGCLITKGSIVHHFNSNKIISKIRGFYQEDLMIPGILPCKASSLKVILERPNLRIVARGRPVNEHLLTNLTADEFLGSLSNFA